MHATLTWQDGKTEQTFLHLDGEAEEIALVLESMSADGNHDEDGVSLEDLLAPVEADWWENSTYRSNSRRERLMVTEMEDTHLLNAIVKKTQIGAGSVLNPHRNMPFTRETLYQLLQDGEARAMISELAKRIEVGEE